MPLDEADKKFIADLIGASLAPEKLAPMLAPILDAHGKAVLEKVPKGIDQAALDAALAKVKPAPESDTKAGKAKDGESPEVAALRAEIQAEKEARAASEKARLETEAKSARDARRNEVKAALGKAGVTADALDDALAVVERTGALVLDGDKPGWKQPNKYNPALEEIVPFDAGAAAWASTANGKRFQAPIEQRGTGDGPAQRTGLNGSSPIRDASGNLDMSKLSAKLTSALA